MGDMKFNHTAHKELWNWLADNPDKKKNEWPGWISNNGLYKCPENFCFACGYALSDDYMEEDCEFKTCPLIWHNNENVHDDGNCWFNCECNGGEYGSWEDAETAELKSWYARQIANLPVREGVECE